MNWMMRKRCRSVTIFSLFFSLGALGLTPKEMMQKETRPLLEQTLQISRSDWESEVGSIEAFDIYNQTVFPVYENVIEELLKRLPETKIFLFARDMEDIHDSLHAVLALHPQGHLLKDKIKVIRVSRKLAENSSDPQLRAWLKAEGMDLTGLYQGTEKILWLDTGYGGQIYRRLVRALVLGVNDGKNSMEQVSGLFSSLELRLLASRETQSFQALLKGIKNGSYISPAAVAGHFESYNRSFPELFEGTQRLKQVGLPLDTHERCNFFINNVERRRPNWRTRGIRLSSDGKTIAEYEPAEAKDARVDRRRLIRFQHQIHDYFGTEKRKNRFLPLVAAAVKRLGLEKPVPWDIEKLAPGFIFEMANGKQYEVLSLVHESTNDKTFKIRELITKVLFSIKAGTPGIAEAEQEIDRDIERRVSLANYSLPHATIADFGKGYFIAKWIEGETGDEFLKRWEKANYSTPPAEIQNQILKLNELIQQSIAQGIYVRNLRPSHLVWSKEQQWVIVNSGSIKTGMASEDILARYKERFGRRWAERYLGTTCAAHFNKGIQ